MAIQERAALKNIFKTEAKPTQQNFADLFDSYWHVHDGVATQDWASTNFASISGNGNYIQNSSSGVQPANFRIQGYGLINNLTIGNTSVAYDSIESASASGFHLSAASDFVVAAPAGHITFNPGNFVGIGTSINNGARLIIDGGPVSLASTTTDFGYGAGFMHYRSDLDRIRAGVGGAYKNLATEDWANSNLIKNQFSTTQGASFNINGTAKVTGFDPNYPFSTSINGASIVCSSIGCLPGDFTALTLARQYGYRADIRFTNIGSATNPAYAIALSSGNPSSFGIDMDNGSGYTRILEFGLGGETIAKYGMQTAQPSPNGAGVWKLGKPVTGAVSVDTTKYIEVMIDGQVVKLLTANP